MINEELELEKNYDNTEVPKFKNGKEELFWKVQHNDLDYDEDDWDCE
jgi:hypothetical protein